MENQIHSLDVLTPNTIYAGGSSYRCIPVRSHINVLPSIAERTSCENLPISHFASIFFIFSSTWKAQCWLPSVLTASLLTTPFLVWFQFSMKLAWLLLPWSKLSKVCCQIPQNVFEDKFTFLWEIKEHQLSRLAQETLETCRCQSHQYIQFGMEWKIVSANLSGIQIRLEDFDIIPTFF